MWGKGHFTASFSKNTDFKNRISDESFFQSSRMGYKLSKLWLFISNYYKLLNY